MSKKNRSGVVYSTLSFPILAKMKPKLLCQPNKICGYGWIAREAEK